MLIPILMKIIMKYLPQYISNGPVCDKGNEEKTDRVPRQHSPDDLVPIVESSQDKSGEADGVRGGCDERPRDSDTPPRE